MDTRTFTAGRTPLTVSQVGLGCTSMTPHSYPDSPRRAEMIEVLRGAVDAGIDFFDTSEIQGPYTGEQLLGDALPTSDVTILTKFGWDIDASGTPTGKVNSRPEVIRRSAEGSLRRLGRDHLDVYMQHRVDPEVPIEEVAGAVGELIDAGKVTHFGLSEASPELIRRAHAECPVTVIEHEHSLWSREPEEELLPLTRELGIGFAAYSPLGKGFLAGSAEPNDDSSSPRLHAENFAANKALGDAVKEFAAAREMTPAQLALGWILARSENIVPIPGSTNLERIRSNAEARPLDEETVAELDRVIAQHRVHGNRYTDKHLSYIPG